MPAKELNPDPFISRTDLGHYLRRDLDEDDLALMAVAASCDIVRNYTRRDFTSSSRTTYDVLDGTGTKALLLSSGPIGGVLTVSERITEDATEDDSGNDEFEHTYERIYDYDVDYEAGLLIRTDGVWKEGRQNYEVTYIYTFGAFIPADVRMVAVTIAARIYDQGIVKQESVGGYQAVFSTASSLDLTPTEKNLLYKYRL